MAFALSPDGGYPRLFRPTTLPDNVVATLDREQNILRIDKEKFNLLSESQQETILRTQEAQIEIVQRKQRKDEDVF